LTVKTPPFAFPENTNTDKKINIIVNLFIIFASP